LITKIEEYTAASARLKESEVAKNQETLDMATAIREKQLAEFNAWLLAVVCTCLFSVGTFLLGVPHGDERKMLND